MRPFGYDQATTTDDAVRLTTSGGEASYLAGGTNLVDLMRLGVARPERLVDVNAVLSRTIEDTDDGGLLVGAGVLNAELAAHPRVRRDYPVLSQALLAGASGQLRNMATTGGNLLQRTRCHYFYDTGTACNKRTPGSGCSAIEGQHRNLAVLGGSAHCIATYPSDMAVAMQVLDAEVLTLGQGGKERRIPLRSFYRLPGETPQIETVLDNGELITHIELPAPPAGRQVYRKVRDRASYAFALVSIAAVVDVADGVIRSVALAFGGLGPRPWRDPAVEQALVGQKPGRGVFDQAATTLLADAHGHGMNDFKIPLARRLLMACLRDLTDTGATA